MLKSFRYRIYPNKAQELLLNKHIGAARSIYNLALETKNNAYYSYGVNLLKIGRFERSSKTFFHCGSINEELTLKDRDCSDTEHDRDVNAVINIKNFALRNSVSGADTYASLHRCIADALDALYINQDELPGLLGVLTP